MARRWRLFQNLRSIAGTGLIGFGVFVLGAKLSDAWWQLSRLAGVSAEATQNFAGLTAVGLVVSQVWRSYLFDRHGFLLGVCGILMSFWPLLLVIAGTVLTGTASGVGSTNSQGKITGTVELTRLRSTCKQRRG
jgi:hypothetical protein